MTIYFFSDISIVVPIIAGQMVSWEMTGVQDYVMKASLHLKCLSTKNDIYNDNRRWFYILFTKIELIYFHEIKLSN